MIRTQGIGDLYREYLGATVFGFDYDLAKSGYPWIKEPKVVPAQCGRGAWLVHSDDSSTMGVHGDLPRVVNALQVPTPRSECRRR